MHSAPLPCPACGAARQRLISSWTRPPLQRWVQPAVPSAFPMLPESSDRHRGKEGEEEGGKIEGDMCERPSIHSSLFVHKKSNICASTDKTYFKK